jgi:hypothetical protein
MDELQIILPDGSGKRMPLEQLMSVKLLFNPIQINKSLLSLQRQKRSSWSTIKRLGLWN